MAAEKSKMKNLTEGSPAKLIIGFAIPMFLGMLFQQFYSMVDTMIVGNGIAAGVEQGRGGGGGGGGGSKASGRRRLYRIAEFYGDWLLHWCVQWICNTGGSEIWRKG